MLTGGGTAGAPVVVQLHFFGKKVEEDFGGEHCTTGTR